MNILFLVIANLCVYNAWIWLINKLMIFHKNQKSAIVIGCLLSGIGATISMLAYHPIIGQIPFLTKAGFSNTIHPESYLIFIIYLLGIVWIAYKIHGNIQKHEYSQAIFFGISWLIITLIGVSGSREYIILYYLFIAFGEEILKSSFGNILYQKYKITPRDIIIFSLISALGFAFIEHIIYLVHTDIFNHLGEAGKLLLQRGVLTTSVHAVFTGCIAYGTMNFIKTNNYYMLGVGVIGGILLHRTYNISMYYNVVVLLPIRAIGSYFILSYLLFESDILYKKA